MSKERLCQQIEFIVEIDKLKQIYRKNFVTDETRHETDAEHSWHLAVMAILLSEYVTDPALNVLRVLKMLLVHDLVEIDAGDTYCFDEQAVAAQSEREQKAADRIFRMLPDEQAADFKALWEEFEQQISIDAGFAAALDRLQPLLLHCNTHGKSWKINGITSSQVYERNKRTKEVSPELGKLVAELIEGAVQKGYLARYK